MTTKPALPPDSTIHTVALAIVSAAVAETYAGHPLWALFAPYDHNPEAILRSDPVWNAMALRVLATVMEAVTPAPQPAPTPPITVSEVPKPLPPPLREVLASFPPPHLDQLRKGARVLWWTRDRVGAIDSYPGIVTRDAFEGPDGPLTTAIVFAPNGISSETGEVVGGELTRFPVGRFTLIPGLELR